VLRLAGLSEWERSRGTEWPNAPPDASGNTAYERGLAKAGHYHIRALAIESAWGWVRFQPASALPQWYPQRFANGRSRLRRIGIVALARTLLIALWRFVETGVVPDGAALKATVHIETLSQYTGCETGLVWVAREETGFAPRTDHEKGRPHLGASQAPRAQAGSGERWADPDTDRRSCEAGKPHAF